MRFPFLSILLPLAWVLTVLPPASAGEAPTVRVAHLQGTTTLPQHPQRVVILNPSTLDIADALGITPAGVPQAGFTYPAHLAKYNGQGYFNAGPWRPTTNSAVSPPPFLWILTRMISCKA